MTDPSSVPPPPPPPPDPPTTTTAYSLPADSFLPASPSLSPSPSAAAPAPAPTFPSTDSAPLSPRLSSATSAGHAADRPRFGSRASILSVDPGIESAGPAARPRRASRLAPRPLQLLRTEDAGPRSSSPTTAVNGSASASPTSPFRRASMYAPKQPATAAVVGNARASIGGSAMVGPLRPTFSTATRGPGAASSASFANSFDAPPSMAGTSTDFALGTKFPSIIASQSTGIDMAAPSTVPTAAPQPPRSDTTPAPGPLTTPTTPDAQSSEALLRSGLHLLMPEVDRDPDTDSDRAPDRQSCLAPLTRLLAICAEVTGLASLYRHWHGSWTYAMCTPEARVWARLDTLVHLLDLACLTLGPILLGFVCALEWPVVVSCLAFGTVLTLVVIVDMVRPRYDQYGELMTTQRAKMAVFWRTKRNRLRVFSCIPWDWAFAAYLLATKHEWTCRNPTYFYEDGSAGTVMRPGAAVLDVRYGYNDDDIPTHLVILSALYAIRMLHAAGSTVWALHVSVPGVSEPIGRLIKNLLLTVLVSHVNAMLFMMLDVHQNTAHRYITRHLIDDVTSLPTSAPFRYAHAYYDAQLSLFFIPRDGIRLIPEVAFQAIEMLFAAVIYGSILGNLAAIVRSLDSKAELHKKAKHRNMRKMFLRKFMLDNRFPPDLQRKVLEQEEFQWVHQQGMDTDELFCGLPSGLRKDIHAHLYLPMINRVPMFKTTDNAFKMALAERITTISVKAGFYVCRVNETAAETYFIRSGQVQILVPDESKVITTLQPGAFFGEIGLLDPAARRTATAKTLCDTQLCVLSRDNFNAILKDHPSMITIFEEAAAARRDADAKRKLAEKDAADRAAAAAAAAAEAAARAKIGSRVGTIASLVSAASAHHSGAMARFTRAGSIFHARAATTTATPSGVGMGTGSRNGEWGTGKKFTGWMGTLRRGSRQSATGGAARLLANAAAAGAGVGEATGSFAAPGGGVGGDVSRASLVTAASSGTNLASLTAPRGQLTPVVSTSRVDVCGSGSTDGEARAPAVLNDTSPPRPGVAAARGGGGSPTAVAARHARTGSHGSTATAGLVGVARRGSTASSLANAYVNGIESPKLAGSPGTAGRRTHHSAGGGGESPTMSGAGGGGSPGTAGRRTNYSAGSGNGSPTMSSGGGGSPRAQANGERESPKSTSPGAARRRMQQHGGSESSESPRSATYPPNATGRDSPSVTQPASPTAARAPGGTSPRMPRVSPLAAVARLQAAEAAAAAAAAAAAGASKPPTTMAGAATASALTASPPQHIRQTPPAPAFVGSLPRGVGSLPHATGAAAASTARPGLSETARRAAAARSLPRPAGHATGAAASMAREHDHDVPSIGTSAVTNAVRTTVVATNGAAPPAIKGGSGREGGVPGDGGSGDANVALVTRPRPDQGVHDPGDPNRGGTLTTRPNSTLSTTTDSGGGAPAPPAVSTTTTNSLPLNIGPMSALHVSMPHGHIPARSASSSNGVVAAGTNGASGDADWVGSGSSFVSAVGGGARSEPDRDHSGGGGSGGTGGGGQGVADPLDVTRGAAGGPTSGTIVRVPSGAGIRGGRPTAEK
ncbi:hypothetical protein GGF31_007968 [Allomyces arbusculus]|nr:hypothetical protein GGF31_007968 [Allomyces arbusculus]